MTSIELGSSVPHFRLPDQTGTIRSLEDFKSRYLVLYFYPKDLTPGCTIESQEFTERMETFKELDAEVIGISGGTSASKRKFCTKHELKQTLLADEDFEVSKQFGVFGEKKFMGRTFLGIHRQTYVIDASRNVARVFSQVTPAGHADQVLSALKELKEISEK